MAYGFMLLETGLYVYQLLDAFLVASRRKTYRLKPVNKPVGYAGVLLLTVLLVGLNRYLISELPVGAHTMHYGGPPLNMLANGDTFVVDRSVRPEELQRGDLILCGADSFNRNVWLGRVMGLPGDTIQVINNELIINSVKNQYKHIEKQLRTDLEGNEFEVDFCMETLPEGRKLGIYRYAEMDSSFNQAAQVVPKGAIFLVSDDRTVYMDSRMTGPFSDAYVKGKALYILISERPQMMGLPL